MAAPAGTLRIAVLQGLPFCMQISGIVSPIATLHRAFLLKSILALLALLIALPVSAAQLTLELDHASKTWQTADLLKHPDVQTVQIIDDVSYKRTMTYRAVPLAVLLPGLEPKSHLQLPWMDSPPNSPPRRCWSKKALVRGWRWKTRRSRGLHWQRASRVLGRFTWCGPTLKQGISARSSGRSRSPGLSS